MKTILIIEDQGPMLRNIALLPEMECYKVLMLVNRNAAAMEILAQPRMG